MKFKVIEGSEILSLVGGLVIGTFKSVNLIVSDEVSTA